MGDMAAMQTKTVGVKFEMCQGDTCDPNREEWLKDFQVDTWVVEE
jgi:hypothetical protein